MLKAFLMKWTESRRANGRYEMEDDGFSLHVSPEAAAAYVAAHYEEISVTNQPGIAAPDVYSRPTSFTGELAGVTLTNAGLIKPLLEAGSLRFSRHSKEALSLLLDGSVNFDTAKIS